MRVLALTKYGAEAASTRQRLLQFAPFLHRHGIEIITRPLLDDEYVRALAQGRRSSRSDIIASYLKRLGTVATAQRYDLIWVHFEAFPYAPAVLERLLLITGRPVIVDFDDAIFHMYDRHRSRLVRRLLSNKLRPLLRLASTVTVGNDYLRHYVERFNPAVTVIPTVVDTDRYVPEERTDTRPPVVGWIGSPSTWRYMEEILSDILPTIRQAGASFRAVGAGPQAQRWAEIESIPWTEATEIAEVQRMDIGVMPLPEEDWARGKCGYKLIQYMACGLPTIASPVGVNSTIVQQGETGYLASTSDQWKTALQRLLDDYNLRRRLGQAGRDRVVDHYSLASQEARLLQAFEAASARNGKRG
jgi:glycosyltransferase involved in cell wall biosynthesis